MSVRVAMIANRFSGILARLAWRAIGPISRDRRGNVAMMFALSAVPRTERLPLAWVVLLPTLLAWVVPLLTLLAWVGPRPQLLFPDYSASWGPHNHLKRWL